MSRNNGKHRKFKNFGYQRNKEKGQQLEGCMGSGEEVFREKLTQPVVCCWLRSFRRQQRMGPAQKLDGLETGAQTPICSTGQDVAAPKELPISSLLTECKYVEHF